MSDGAAVSKTVGENESGGWFGDPLNGAIVHWADFKWVDAEGDPSPAYTTRCAGQISGVAKASATGGGMTNADALSAGFLQSEVVVWGQYAYAQAGQPPTPDDSATYFHSTDLTGGAGGATVRIILNIELGGQANAYVYPSSSAKSSISSTYSVTTTLLEDLGGGGP